MIFLYFKEFSLLNFKKFVKFIKIIVKFLSIRIFVVFVCELYSVCSIWWLMGFFLCIGLFVNCLVDFCSDFIKELFVGFG